MNTVVLLLLSAQPSAAFSGTLPAWLAGCWVQRTDEFVYEEQWMAPAGGVMPGTSRTLAQGKLAGTEFLRIEINEDGLLQYVALPSGQALTTFTLTEAAERRLVFENLQHDFPQRIVYALENDILAVRVEGGGQGFDLAMRRERCAAD